MLGRDSSNRGIEAEAAYLFRHAVLRDAAYQLQMPAERARLHRLAMEIIETLIADAAQADLRLAVSGELADHALAARAPLLEESEEAQRLADKEAAYLGQALIFAEREFRHAELQDYATRISRHSRVSGSERAAALMKAAVSQGMLGQNEQALRLLEAAKILCEPFQRCRWHEQKARLLQNTGQLTLAEAEYQTGLALPPIPGDEADRNHLRGNLGTLYVPMGRIPEAESVLQSALEALRAAEDRRAQAVALGSLGLLRLHTGRIVESKPYFESALELARQVRDLAYSGVCLANLSLVADSEEAEELSRSAVDLFQRVGDWRNLSLMLSNRSAMYSRLGQPQNALADVTRALQIAREMDDPDAIAFALCQLGEVHHHFGRNDDAIAAYSEAAALALRHGIMRVAGMAMGHRANVYYDQRRHEEAASEYAAAAEISESAHDAENQGIWIARQAVALAAMGRESEAKPIWERAVAIVGDQLNGELLKDLNEFLKEARQRFKETSGG